MDRGAWRATVHGPRSWTRLSDKAQSSPDKLPYLRGEKCAALKNAAISREGLHLGRSCGGSGEGRGLAPPPALHWLPLKRDPGSALRFDVCNWRGSHSPAGPETWQPQPGGAPAVDSGSGPGGLVPGPRQVGAEEAWP